MSTIHSSQPLVDPNDPRLLSRRQSSLCRTRGPLIDDRCEYLAAQVRGKSILDVGCVNHFAMRSGDPDWLHAHLARHAASCLGADVLAEDIQILQDEGYDVVQLDITCESLAQTFDAIVCGEVNEHVGRAAGLFINCRKMLTPEGRLFVTTPNPWYINYILKSMYSTMPVVDSVEHVAWYEPSVLSRLAEDNGFRLASYHGIRVRRVNTLKARLFFSLVPLWCALGVRKECFAKSILYEFQPQCSA